MNLDFRQLLGRIPETVLDDCRESIEGLSIAGIESIESLCDAIESEEISPELRRFACWLARFDGTGATVRPLLKAFRGVDEGLFWEAGIALGLSKRKEAFEPLADGLRFGGPDGRRAASAYALGLLGDRRAIPYLVETLRSSKCELARDHAAEALGQLPSVASIESLIEALSDSHVAVFVSASYALGLIGDSRALPALHAKLNEIRSYSNGHRDDEDAVRSAIQSIELYRDLH
ncbi:MAG: HEAT repeat domain-containing protein [Pyrinomonadaceae bacterium]